MVRLVAEAMAASNTTWCSYPSLPWRADRAGDKTALMNHYGWPVHALRKSWGHLDGISRAPIGSAYSDGAKPTKHCQLHAVAKHIFSDLLAGVHQQADCLLLADVQHVAELDSLSPVLLREGGKLQETT